MGNSNSLVQYEDFEGQNYLEIKTKYVRLPNSNYFLSVKHYSILLFEYVDKQLNTMGWVIFSEPLGAISPDNL